jgi:hypothetical protein
MKLWWLAGCTTLEFAKEIVVTNLRYYPGILPPTTEENHVTKTVTISSPRAEV